MVQGDRNQKFMIPRHEIEQNTDLLTTVLYELVPVNRPVHILCIGTDRSTGDALGPLVGTFLQQLSFPHPVHGDLDNPVHAENLSERLSGIPSSSFIIAIDSGLANAAHVGGIQVINGPLLPGLGVNKKLPACGDIAIQGFVNIGGYMEYLVLQNTRLAIVWNMARYIASQLNKVLGIRAYDQVAVSATSATEDKYKKLDHKA